MTEHIKPVTTEDLEKAFGGGRSRELYDRVALAATKERISLADLEHQVKGGIFVSPAMARRLNLIDSDIASLTNVGPHGQAGDSTAQRT